MNEAQFKCLYWLNDLTEPRGVLCVPFVSIERETGYSRRLVRRNIRALARKGFAEYYKALWSDEGPAGAGYCITKAGREFIERAEQIVTNQEVR